ncbi:MAG TPA: polyprenyl synthetase family protein [Gemmatimonadales bacterium]|nr:polyprenyl synthetase family protein [Gemmatimonadales bacterium]
MSSQAGAVSLSELQAPVVEGLSGVRVEIRRLIEADFPLIAEVNAHLLQMQGKMFRPTLVLLADLATGSRDPRATSFAAIVELIHLATLVHDDAVDHSVLRRGMPTINALFSHQISVIMGDYLYSRAVIELVRLEDLGALRVLSRVTNEMTIGEMRQLLAHDPLNFSEADYDLLIRSKTASLMSGACEVGALRAPEHQREAMARFGYHLGMAFQIVDDLLDFTADEAVTGKPSGLDLREHKVTLPLIHALPRRAPPQRRAVEVLMENPEPTEAEIHAVVSAVEVAGGLEYARQRAQEFIMAAEADLEVIPPGVPRDTLRASLGYVVERRR